MRSGKIKAERIGEQVEHLVSGDKKATGDDPEWTSPLSFQSRRPNTRVYNKLNLLVGTKATATTLATWQSFYFSEKF